MLQSRYLTALLHRLLLYEEQETRSVKGARLMERLRPGQGRRLAALLVVLATVSTVGSAHSLMAQVSTPRPISRPFHGASHVIIPQMRSYHVGGGQTAITVKSVEHTTGWNLNPRHRYALR